MRALIVLALLMLATPAAAQDAQRGKALFEPCGRCHSLKNNDGIGPNLRGVVGRKAGSQKGYTGYSGGMKSSFIVWDEATLNAYLAAPRVIVPRTSMRGAGVDVADPQDRRDLIAYLKVAR